MSLEYYMTASNIQDGARKKAVLLHLAGNKVQDIFHTLPEPGEDYTGALAALNAYFKPKRNIPFERHQFRQATQMPGEGIDSFVTKLRQLAKTCEFDNDEDAIRDQVIDKCLSGRLRRRLLRENSLTLDSLLQISKAFESAEAQASQMELTPASPPHSVNALSHQNNHKKKWQKFSSGKPRAATNKNARNVEEKPQSEIVCFCCGLAGHKARDPNCPALGKKCNKCGKENHFGRVCKSSQQKKPSRSGVHLVTADDDSSEDEYLFALGHSSKTVTVNINAVDTAVIIDSGASVNVLDADTFTKLLRHGDIQLSECKKRILPYGATKPLPVKGSFQANVFSPDTNRTVQATFIVVETSNSGSLLSKNTATQLDLLRVGPGDDVPVNLLDMNSSTEAIVTRFPAVFDGVGKLKDYQLTIHTDNSVTPIAQPLRRTPFHVRKDVERKLKELEDLDIIEDADGPTPWVSPLVAVPKSNGDIRVCVDMRRVNEAIIRERHPIPTLEETLHSLNGATVFSKLDLRWGYHQIELSPESRALTTFSTHTGLKRYKRLIFGLSSASEVYQHIIQRTLAGIPGARNISDDILVFGKDQADHDKQLALTLTRLQDKGLTLNREKCLFGVPELNFFGHKVSAAGISPDKTKVQAVQEARVPANVSELRSFLGLANFFARYIPHFATLAEPLRQLTRANTQWAWLPQHQSSFDKLKSALTSEQVMAHYDPAADTHLKVDASPFGLGAILLQSGPNSELRPVAYASRTLSSVERRYSQTEREALAVVWGCERFHLYLFGQEFTLHTDHKPLEVIYSPKSKPPPRIERWALRLQPYRFRIQYMPGKTNPADVLSRLPQSELTCLSRNAAEEYVNYITTKSVPKAFTLEQLVSASKEDPVIQAILQSLVSGKWPTSQEVQPFQKVKEELSESHGLLLRNTRIVIPKSLQKAVLHSAHEGHQGIVRTKHMVREKVWWPGIDKQIEEMIKTCIPCQSMAPKSPPEPLQPSTMPDMPWQTIHVDLCGPFPTGESLLVCEDACTRWPEVELVKSTSTTTVLNRLDRIFSTHGLPGQVVTDNGPQFTSDEFSGYVQEHGIAHRKVTPYWPQANSAVERFNRTVEKAIRAAHVEGKDWRKELNSFLLNYRATPHPSTGASPAFLHLGREIRTKVPQLNVKTTASLENALKKAQAVDRRVKQKMAVFTDKKRKAKPSNVSTGDRVLLQQRKRDKLSTRFDSKPYTVVKKCGVSVVLKRSGEPPIMRNISLVHKMPDKQIFPQGEDDTDTFDCDFEVTNPVQGQPPAVPPVQRQRPVRNVRRPRYFQDYITQ